MPILNSILVAVFCLTIVFLVLACLFGLIRLFSFGVNVIEKKAAKTLSEKETPVPADTTVFAVTNKPIVAPEDDFSAGTLKLVNVDERTAAMIMAIVSEESGIPLSELCFKSIKEIPKE